ncbi:MAG: lipid-transfer protein [Gammaproteobacteria bacterium]
MRASDQQATIVGIGQTEFSKNSGRSELTLAAEASLAALTDAGLGVEAIDGMVTFSWDSNDELELMRCLGIPSLRWTARAPFGGAAACATVQLAAAAVSTGMANAVLVYRAFNERSGSRYGQPLAVQTGESAHYHRYGLDTPAKAYALWFQRYLHTYGVTSEDLGRYSVIARQHAATNPRAWFYQRPITLADHQRSRWIVEPVLRLLDCCQESDGGVALVITTAARARDLAQPGVRILAASQRHPTEGHFMYDYYREDLAELAGTRQLSAELWQTSGVGPQDIDAAMIYENFSPIVFLGLEAHGFCGRGEARDFIRDGHIALGGRLPVNTHGGLLGEGYIHGVNNILEGVRQVRGTAANQVPGAAHVLVSALYSAIVLGKV